MPLPLEVIGTIACGGEAHRLQATDDGLRLLDHEDERQRILDALAGTSGCHEIQAAWDRFLHRFDNQSRDTQRLDYVEWLIPDPEFVEWYEDHYRKQLASADRIAAHLASALAAPDVDAERAATLRSQRQSVQDTRPLSKLPPNLRTSLALQWIEHVLDFGEISDSGREQRLRRAVAACWSSFAADGAPAPEAHRALVWDLRPHRWPAK